ncbi:MAG: GntR family transcriptional regulator, partial [Mesorhizobium sp.]
MRARGELPGAPATRVAIATLPPLDRGKQVMEALADYVERAALKSGDRLPTERELMAALSVGRSTIREAMGRFEALGVT